MRKDYYRLKLVDVKEIDSLRLEEIEFAEELEKIDREVQIKTRTGNI